MPVNDRDLVVVEDTHSRRTKPSLSTISSTPFVDDEADTASSAQVYLRDRLYGYLLRAVDHSVVRIA